MANRLSNIVDPSGRPFEVAVLNSKQTDEAKVAGLHRRFSEHPTSGLTPYRLAQIMRAAEQGQLVEQAEMAEDMEEKDGHIFSEVQKRKLAMQSIEWQIEPPRNATAAEKKAAEFIWERLAYLDLADVIFDMADAILKSYSCLTIEWGLIDGYQTPINIEQVPASWFTTPQEKRNELQLMNDQGGSEVVVKDGNVVEFDFYSWEEPEDAILTSPYIAIPQKANLKITWSSELYPYASDTILIFAKPVTATTTVPTSAR